MTVKISPLFNDAQLDASGNPATGYKLFTYTSGSSTKQTVYQDSAGVTQHTNPIVLNSRGEPPALIWLTAGVSYKFVFTSPTDTDPPVSPIRTVDVVTGVNDTTSAFDEWVAGPAPTFISATSFSLAGDQTSTFQVGRRVKTTNSGGTVYSTILTSVFTTLTTVTVVNDSGVLDSGLSAVFYGLLSKTNDSLPRNSVAYSNMAIATGRNIAARTNSSTPNSKIDITSDELILKDATNVAFIARSVSVTIDITASGANGLDTGAEASGTWYYGWIIAKPDGTTAGLISASATAPTMPSGYTYKALATAVRNDGSSNFLKYRQLGNTAYFEAQQIVLTAGTSGGEASVSLAAAVPPIALSIRIFVENAGTPGAASQIDGINIRVVTGSDFAIVNATGQVAGVQVRNSTALEIPNISQNVIYGFITLSQFTTAHAANIAVTGFKLPLGGE